MLQLVPMITHADCVQLADDYTGNESKVLQVHTYVHRLEVTCISYVLESKTNIKVIHHPCCLFRECSLQVLLLNFTQTYVIFQSVDIWPEVSSGTQSLAVAGNNVLWTGSALHGSMHMNTVPVKNGLMV